MSTKVAKTTSDTSAHEVSATFVIVRTLVDTTWRMFIPPAVGAVIGLQLEANGVHQAAVWGGSIGVIASGLLVWQQYRGVNGTKKS
jgi:uncharacterized membrane protein